MPLPLLQATPRFDRLALPRESFAGLYVHVPFCFHKCHYCDFYSITRQTPQRMASFVDRTLAEAEQWRDWPRELRTIFFGGGTPSLLPLEEMRRLIVGLRERLDFTRVGEFTVEINPATADADFCNMLRDQGVDRLSLGAQSFDRDELKTLERHHDPADVDRSLALAREAGFERINFDLIYAIPGQSLESWQRSLERAIELGTDHLSCYALTYEPNTALTVRHRLGQFTATEDSLEIEMMHYTRERLRRAGFEAYEISNHARPGQACRHNLLYWRGENYLGLGPGAASHASGHRWKNRPHLGEWERAVDAGNVPAAELEIVSPAARVGERIMLGLRLRDGIDLESLRPLDTIDRAWTIAREMQSLGFVEITGSTLTLTRRGIEVADGVAAKFL